MRRAKRTRVMDGIGPGEMKLPPHQPRIFTSYREASSWAASIAREHRVAVHVERVGENWRVRLGEHDATLAEEELERREAEARKRLALERAIADAQRRKVRSDYYKSLPLEGLKVLWENRDFLVFEDDKEKVLLYLVVRERHGLPADPDTQLEVWANSAGIRSCGSCKGAGKGCLRCNGRGYEPL